MLRETQFFFFVQLAVETYLEILDILDREARAPEKLFLELALITALFLLMWVRHTQLYLELICCHWKLHGLV